MRMSYTCYGVPACSRRAAPAERRARRRSFRRRRLLRTYCAEEPAAHAIFGHSLGPGVSTRVGKEGNDQRAFPRVFTFFFLAKQRSLDDHGKASGNGPEAPGSEAPGPDGSARKRGGEEGEEREGRRGERSGFRSLRSPRSTTQTLRPAASLLPSSGAHCIGRSVACSYYRAATLGGRCAARPPCQSAWRSVREHAASDVGSEMRHHV